jgi:hypothetical protein
LLFIYPELALTTSSYSPYISNTQGMFLIPWGFCLFILNDMIAISTGPSNGSSQKKGPRCSGDQWAQVAEWAILPNYSLCCVFRSVAEWTRMSVRRYF